MDKTLLPEAFPQGGDLACHGHVPNDPPTPATAPAVSAPQYPLADPCQMQQRAATTAPPAVVTPATLTAMKAAKRWLLWRAVFVDGKWKKKPFYTNGSARGDTDTPADSYLLSTFDKAVDAWRSGSGRWTGIGFALGFDGCGYWQGLDLDRLDPEMLHETAKAMLGYVEVTPSGRGLHAIGYGRQFQNLNQNGSGIEAYSSKRFFTFTQQTITDALLTCLADWIESALVAIHGDRAKRSGVTTGVIPTKALLASPPAVRSDAEIWQAVACSANAEKVFGLCRIDGAKKDGQDLSYFDAALMQCLVIHTPNNEQLMRLFKSTPLAQREKVLVRTDYIIRTVNQARITRDKELSDLLAEAAENKVAQDNSGLGQTLAAFSANQKAKAEQDAAFKATVQRLADNLLLNNGKSG